MIVLQLIVVGLEHSAPEIAILVEIYLFNCFHSIYILV